MSNLLRNFGLPDMGVGYQKFQAGSPDGYLDFGVISTPVIVHVNNIYIYIYIYIYISYAMKEYAKKSSQPE